MAQPSPSTGFTRGKATTVDTGIAVRQWQNATTLRISFRYRGIECRETLALPATKANLQYAQRLRGEILNAIAKGTFQYGHYFPNSKRARIFGHVNANPLIGDLLAQFLTQAKRTLQPSTPATNASVTPIYFPP
jgi:integrase